MSPRVGEPPQFIDFSDPNYQPNYLKQNYISKQRSQAISDKKEQKKNVKKTIDWTPSSKYCSPPINKIPKDTNKSIEMRIA